MQHQPKHISLCAAQAPSAWSWHGTSAEEIRGIFKGLAIARGGGGEG
jgi:hypothetical protein